jgi:hypothetical protein
LLLEGSGKVEKTTLIFLLTACYEDQQSSWGVSFISR